MPCRSDDDEWYRQNGVENRNRESNKTEHNSDLAVLLCEAMQLIVRHKMLDYTSTELQSWWEQHQQHDRNRVRTQWKEMKHSPKRRSELLSKLSAYEQQFVEDTQK